MQLFVPRTRTATSVVEDGDKVNRECWIDEFEGGGEVVRGVQRRKRGTAKIRRSDLVVLVCAKCNRKSW